MVTRLSELQEIPLFPLNSVLFPKGKLSLQIFEQRYLDLVSSSLKADTGFGVTLLKDGYEVVKPGKVQTMYSIGTYAKIIDWTQLDNGLLGITVEGEKKFKIEECWCTTGNLFMAKVRFSDRDASDSLPIPLEDDRSGMTQLLQLLEEHPAVQDMNLQIDYENLWDLGWRLSELIPVALQIKQELLELDDPWERIKVIEEAIHFLSYGEDM
jgi:Lon protease-like protein